MKSIIRSSFLIVIIIPVICSGYSKDNVLVVFNDMSPISIETAMFYKRARGLENKNLFTIKTYPREEVSRIIFDKDIKEPIKRYLIENSMQDTILYIITTKGVPLKISGSGGRNGDHAAVDSELALLYREMIYGDFFKKGKINNPYFNVDPLFFGTRYFNHRDFDIYLVTRLTGFTIEDIKGLIKRGTGGLKTNPNNGSFIFDQKGDKENPGDLWLKQAADLLKERQHTAKLEGTAHFLNSMENVMGYAGWGSNDPNYFGRFLRNKYLDGALATNYVSSNGRTFHEPPKSWSPGNFGNKENYFYGSPQSLAGDFIREGITGVCCNVYEPYLDACVRPNILFPAYTMGYNLAESFYMATKYLSWQTTIVGDPLCCPFGNSEIDFKATEKHDYFQERKLKIKKLCSAKDKDAGKWNIIGQAYLAKNNLPMATKAFQEASLLDKKHLSSFIKVAIAYQKLDELSQAEDIYREILKINPDYVLALNNLAYLLADRGDKLDEAMLIAKKAFQLEPSYNVIDTYGWVCYKKKDCSRALKLFKDALQINSNNPVVLFHLGLTYMKLGDQEKAGLMLEKALNIARYFSGAEKAKKILSELKKTK